jgi:hypothetical protein
VVKIGLSETTLVSRSTSGLTNIGASERSHRVDSEEFYRLLEGQVIDDTNLFTSTTTTTTVLTALLAVKRPTNASARKPKTRCHRPSSVAHGPLLLVPGARRNRRRADR